MNALTERAFPRSREKRTERRAAGLATLFVAALGVACADKVFYPRFVGSPQMTLQITTTGAQVASPPKMLIALAAYISTVEIEKTDTFRILGLTTAPVTASTQQVSLKVDLTECLADGTRRGSRDACSFKLLLVLSDSVPFDVDTSDFFDRAYDIAFLGPFDAAPGKPPTIPAVDLSITRFAVHQWVSDYALQLGGPETPRFFDGPITGYPTGSSSATATLFGVTTGFIPNPQSGQSGQNFGGQSGAQLAIFQNGTWRRVNGPPNVRFTDVTALGPSDAYMAGTDGLYHYDGTSITAVSAVRENLRSIASVTTSGGARYVVAGTQNGGVWFGNTTTWQRYSTNTTQDISGVCVTGPTEAFAASRSGGGLFRFDGTSWTSVPSSFTAPKGELQCPAPGQAFVWAEGVALLKWNGSGWTQMTGSGLKRPIQWAVASPTEIYGVADSGGTNRAFYRFDGVSWREVARLQFTQPPVLRPWADPRGGAAYVASSSGRVELVTPNSARVVSYLPSMRDVMMTSGTSAFAVGLNLFLARWDGSRWNVDAPPQGTPTNRVLQGVWSNGPSNAWAVGAGSAILRWDGTNWGVVSDFNRPVVSPVEAYNAVWGAGGSVWIAGDQSIVRCTAAIICTKDAVAASGPFYGIWGTSATNAFAVGALGRILHFDGVSWTAMASPTTLRLGRVWGTSATNVFAVGDSVLVQYDGLAWKNVPLTDGLGDLMRGLPPSGQVGFPHQLGLWAARPNEVYVGMPGGRIVRFNAFDWSEMPTANQGRVVGISGFSNGCAIAVTDGAGNSGPTLLRGAGPAGCLSAPMGAPASWP